MGSCPLLLLPDPQQLGGKFPIYCSVVHLFLIIFPSWCLFCTKMTGEESWAAHGDLKGFNSFSRLVKGAWGSCAEPKMTVAV